MLMVKLYATEDPVAEPVPVIACWLVTLNAERTVPLKLVFSRT